MKLVALALALALPALAAARDLPAPVHDALARAGVPDNAAAIVVEPVDSGTPSVALRADAPVNPASVMKLLTSSAALDLLGPAFTFHTDVLLAGDLSSDGVLDFDLAEQGVRNGLPTRYAWIAAFGLVVTLVWLYIEMLRLLAILRGD